MLNWRGKEFVRLLKRNITGHFMMGGFMGMGRCSENGKPGFTPVSHASPSRAIHLQLLGLIIN